VKILGIKVSKIPLDPHLEKGTKVRGFRKGKKRGAHNQSPPFEKGGKGGFKVSF